MRKRPRFALTIALLLWAPPLAVAKPHTLHREAIPDGTLWFCFADSSLKNSPSVCERDQPLAGLLDGGAGSVEQKTAWVATGRDPKTRHFVRIASATAAQCAARVKAELARFTSVSACEEVGATEAAPVDKSLVEKGTGWWCYEDQGSLGLGAVVTSKEHCLRTKHECRFQHWGVTDDNMAMLTVLGDKGCERSATAFVLTTNDGYKATRTREDCELTRHSSPDRTACTQLP